MKKIYHANTNQKKAGIAIGISDKADSKINIKSKKRHHNNKGINLSKGYNILKRVCRVSKYISQKPTELRGETEKPIIRAGDRNTSLLVTKSVRL